MGDDDISPDTTNSDAQLDESARRRLTQAILESYERKLVLWEGRRADLKAGTKTYDEVAAEEGVMNEHELRLFALRFKPLHEMPDDADLVAQHDINEYWEKRRNRMIDRDIEWRIRKYTDKVADWREVVATLIKE